MIWALVGAAAVAIVAAVWGWVRAIRAEREAAAARAHAKLADLKIVRDRALETASATREDILALDREIAATRGRLVKAKAKADRITVDEAIEIVRRLPYVALLACSIAASAPAAAQVKMERDGVEGVWIESDRFVRMAVDLEAFADAKLLIEELTLRIDAAETERAALMKAISASVAVHEVAINAVAEAERAKLAALESNSDGFWPWLTGAAIGFALGVLGAFGASLAL